MWSLRRNFYNKDILMIHYDKLLELKSKTENSFLKNQICILLKQYDELGRNANNIPYELRTWPNMYFGISLSDKRNFELIQLAIKDCMNDWIRFGSEIYTASGYAFLNGNLELAIELKNLNERACTCSFPTRRDVLQIVSEETLDYLLSFVETGCCIEKDRKIIFYDGDGYILMDTTKLVHQKNKVN